MPPFERPELDEDELDPSFCKVAAADVVEEADDELVELDGAEVGVGVVFEFVVVMTTTVVPSLDPELESFVVTREVMRLVDGAEVGAVIEDVTTAVVLDDGSLVVKSEEVPGEDDESNGEVAGADEEITIREAL